LRKGVASHIVFLRGLISAGTERRDPPPQPRHDDADRRRHHRRLYSLATVLGLPGNDFFRELVTPIDIMLLDHWIEIRSLMGAGAALEKLVALIPDTAHLLDNDGSTRDIAVAGLRGGGDRLQRGCYSGGGRRAHALGHRPGPRGWRGADVGEHSDLRLECPATAPD